MTSRKAVLAMLALGVALRVLLAVQALLPSHDGGISWLAATCSQADYDVAREALNPPFGVATRISDWSTFFSVRQPGCFGEIARGLVDTDIHPPLYFWVLHALFVGFGASLLTGLLGNVAIWLVGCLGLWVWTRQERAPSILPTALFFWAVSPVALGTSGVMRQYELYGVLALWFALAITRAVRAPGAPIAVAIGVLSSIGCFTHYQFPLVMAVGGLYCVWQWRSDSAKGRALLTVGASLLFGGLCAAWLLPEGWFESVLRQRSQANPASLAQLPARLGRSLAVMVHFFVPTEGVAAIPPGFAAVPVAIWGALKLRGGAARREFANALAGPAVFFAIGNFAILLISYLVFLSPFHAMRGCYAAIVTPFVALTFAGLVERRPATRRPLLAVMLVGSCWWALSETARYQLDRDAAEYLSNAQEVVVDNTRRGAWPRVYPLIGQTTTVFVVPQDRVPQCAPMADAFLLLSNASYETKRDKREDFLQNCMSSGWSVDEHPAADYLKLVSLSPPASP